MPVVNCRCHVKLSNSIAGETKEPRSIAPKRLPRPTTLEAQRTVGSCIIHLLSPLRTTVVVRFPDPLGLLDTPVGTLHVRRGSPFCKGHCRSLKHCEDSLAVECRPSKLSRIVAEAAQLARQNSALSWLLTLFPQQGKPSPVGRTSGSPPRGWTPRRMRVKHLDLFHLPCRKTFADRGVER